MKAKWMMCAVSCVVALPSWGAATEKSWNELEQLFRGVPMEARRCTGPLFWMHGDESQAQLEGELARVVEGHNGIFTAEPRPHKDWLGEGWYRDLGICLDFARKHELKLIIYDDWWWPSQMMGGRVPAQYGSKRLVAEAANVTGPQAFSAGGYAESNLIAVVAGRVTEGDAVEGGSLVDLTGSVKNGTLNWNTPAGTWRVMKFSWSFNGTHGGQQKYISVDGADEACTAWFINAVYQPHFDRFKADYGKTIAGYFYDEPETQGDWGSVLRTVAAERKLDLKKLLVGYKFKLAGEEQVAAFYSYLDCFADAWGRTMYGGMSAWCRARKVYSMGHFMEHNNDLYSRTLSGGNMMQLQRYSDMGGMDLVCNQVYPGERKEGLYQMPKIASSISHTYDKADDIAFCEIYGGYGQKLTYPQMKWLADWHQVRGVNFLIPHSFNPRAPFDHDFPPYFFNGGFEPRWPLYRVWADYNNRLSTLLTGGRHVAPVAFLQLGQSIHVGENQRPEKLTSALQDALFDCDWLLYDAWENAAQLAGKKIKLHKESYRVLVLPAVEVLPYPTLLKAQQFFEGGGVVIAYGRLPTKSATLGFGVQDIAALRAKLWGDAKPGLTCCKTSAAGGRSYFLPAEPSAADLQKVLTCDAGIHPTLEVLEGLTGDWLHVLHRQKSGRDVFLVCNQHHEGAARAFTFKVTAEGEPECWDALRNEITAVPYRRVDAHTVEVDLTLEPAESVLLVFQSQKRNLPLRLDARAKSVGAPLVVSDTRTHAVQAPAAKLVVTKATYGVPGDAKRSRDVRKRLQKMIDAGEQEIQVSQLAKGDDPAYGVVKTLVVEGTRGDQRLTLRGKDTQSIALTEHPSALNGELKRIAAGRRYTGSPVVADPFDGVCEIPAAIKLAASRVYLEMDEMLPEAAARVTVNGQDAGGCIGNPLRLEITAHLKAGANTIRIEPFAPKSAKLVVYDGSAQK
ncbi:MAG: glycosyl hydrolase [Kiritimatiellaeota bacterium]|nr:glycosyl hydrolase [Kiritimatiellota bacterium]